MAAIPIAEIPNAPRTGDPVLTGGGGTRADISDTTRSLLRPTMGTEGVEAHARAMQNLGAGIQNLGESANKVAAVVSDFIDQKVEAKNYDAKNQIGQFYDENTPALRQTVRGQPESAIAPAMAEFDQKARSRIAELPFTAKGREAALQEHRRRMLYLGHTLKDDNFQQFIENSRTTAQTHADHLYDQGQYERADDILQEGLQRGLFNKNEVTDIQDGARLRQERRHFDQVRTTDPWLFRDVMADGERSGKSDLFPSLNGQKQDFRYWRQQAEAEIVRRDVETGYAAYRDVLAGKLDNKSAIRKQVGRDLPEDRIALLVKLTRDDPSYGAQSMTELHTAVRAFAPLSDRDKTTYDTLQQRIATTVPKSMQAAFTDELYQAWQSRGAFDENSAIRKEQAGHFRRIDSLAKSGLLGDNGLNGKDEVISRDKADLVGARTELMKAEVERFMHANPKANSKLINEKIGEMAANQGLLKLGANLFQQRILPRP